MNIAEESTKLKEKRYRIRQNLWALNDISVVDSYSITTNNCRVKFNILIQLVKVSSIIMNEWQRKKQ